MINSENIIFPVPGGPEFEAIEKIHRGCDGVIAFVMNGEFTEQVFLKRSDLQMWFPWFIDQLRRDSYFTLNTFFDRGKKPSREERNLRYLNLAWVDLDCYKMGLKPWDTIGKVGQLMEDGFLPQISAMAKSGQGVWAFWMLRDHKNHSSPVSAHKDKLFLWKRIQRAIHSRLEHLGADPGAKDGARYARIPGSINGKSGETVSYLFLSGPEGPATYDLYELSAFFGLNEPKRTQLKVVKREGDNSEEKEEKDPVKAAAGRLSWKSQVARKLRDWENLCIMRNGIEEGKPSRNQAMLLGASLHLRAGNSVKETITKLTRWNESFKPPLSEQELRSAIAQAQKINKSTSRPFQYVTMRHWLGVTPDEAERLEGEYYPQEKPTKAERINTRREVLKQIILNTHPKPSRRDAQSLLHERGYPVSLRTVQLDYVAIEEDMHRAAQKKLSFARGA